MTTSERSQAYGRVMATIQDVGPSKLLPAEQDRVREAADSLLFCEDLERDDAARAALLDVRALMNELVVSERWLEPTAESFLQDIEGCGPLLSV